MLEAMQTARAFASPTAAASGPLRMAFVFVPNGVNVEHWVPKRIGYAYDLPSILEPLARVRDDVNVLSGLTHDRGRGNGDGPGDHARSASTFLTGCQPRKTDGGNLFVGVSTDQIAAQHLGHQTRFPSLELACDRTRDTGNCDSGYSCAYSHNISWSSPSTPVAEEIDPRLVFERLFGSQSEQGKLAGAERRARRRSVLDFVAEDVRRLQNRVGRADQLKLHEYMAAVRQIELRLERDSMVDTADLGATSRPDGIPADYAAHVRLMLDMMVLAFQTDQTRISTCMLAHEGSNRSYREINVPDGHHDLSHHGGDAEKLDKIRRINQYHMQQFAYFVERLKSIPEGDGSLLDQCMIVYGSGISDGNRHNRENLPVLLAGRGGGSIETGRHVHYAEETPMSNLFVSMLHRMSVPVTHVGDSTGPLDQLG
jgi:hypothetical protein